MTVLKRKHLFFAYYTQIYLILSVLCMTVITAAVHRAPLMEAVSFFLFQVLCVILPGTAVNCLLQIKQLSRVENILISYVWGFLLNIGVYLLTVPFGMGVHMKVIYAFLAAMSIAVLIYKADKSSVTGNHIEKSEVIGIAVTTVLFVIYLFVFSLRWAMTEQGKDFNNDLLFWIGNTIALKEKFLPIDFRSLYDGYKYHYFGSMQQAVAALVTDMPVFNLAVRYSFIEGTLILGLSASCLALRMIKNYKAAILTLALVLFSTGFEEQSVVTYIWHIYLVPMSFEIACSLGMIIFLLLCIQNGEKKINPFILTTLVCCLVVCTGTKGPAGMIALCGIGVMCIYWMFVRKEYGKSIFYGAASLLSFCIVYVLLLASKQQGYLVETAVSDVVNSTPDSVNAGGVIEVLRERLSSVVMWLSGYFRYVLLVNPWTFVPGMLFSVYKIVRRSISVEQVVMFVMVAVGSVLGYHMHYGGDSQMYFTLSVFPYAALLVGTGIDSLCRLYERKGNVYKVAETIVFVLLLLSIGYGTMHSNYRGHFQEHCRIGGAVLRDIPCEDITTWNWKMSRSEYQAYDWIRENTEPSAVFLSDVFFINRYESYYYPGVFTERRIFFYRNDSDIEPGQACYGGDESAVETLKEKGIDYIIQNKYRSPDFKLSEVLGEKKYENDEMAVFKLR